MTSRFAFALLAMLAALAPAAAQDWPTKTVRLIVPFGPGSTPDMVGRVIADHLQQTLGQSFVIENRPGASAMTGTDLVAKAEPDGHTIGISLGGALAINTLLFAKMPYDPKRDIALITMLATQPSLLVVNAGLGVKPIEMDLLAIALERAVNHRQLQEQVRLLQERVDQTHRFDELIGESAAMQALFDQLTRVADTESSILITGESGTGKELVARSLHNRSGRRKGPFMAVNCAAIPETLIESELFGHAKGAFTDARNARKGLFQQADGGTLFLDEIGEMPLAMQAKLLRALEESKLRPVGDDQEISFDVRLLSATNRDLESAIEDDAGGAAMKRLMFAVWIGLAAGACGSDAPSPQPDASVDPDPLAVTTTAAPGSLDDLHERILAKRCSGQPGLCHNGQFEPNLSTPGLTYAYLVNRPGIEKPALLRVSPGMAAASLFIDKIRNRNGVATQMPLGAEPLAEEDIVALETWINDGALRAPGAAPAPVLNNPPKRPQIGIFNTSDVRLDGAGPVTAAVGTTLRLRHTVQDFETADAAMPFAAFVLTIGDKNVVLGTGNDPQLGPSTFEAGGPPAQGDTFNWRRDWTITNPMQVRDQAGALSNIDPRGKAVSILALYIDGQPGSAGSMVALETSTTTINIP